MFGWLKGRDARSRDPATITALGNDGRPRPPLFPGLMKTEDATAEQKRACIEWAIAWTKAQGVSAAELVPLFDDYLIGKRISKRTPGEVALSMSVQALRRAADLNRIAKSSRALPWVEFRLGPQECPCELARSMDHVVRPASSASIIPLDGCDNLECSCWQQSMTSRQQDAKGKAEE